MAAKNPVDINVHTSGVEIPEVALDLFINGQDGTGGVVNSSAVMRLARVMQIPGAGVKTSVVAGDPKADWVEDSDEKPVSTPTLNTKTLIPYTLAVIVPMSNRFRANKEALANYIMADLPRVLADKFYSTVLNGTAPGDGFDVLTAAETVVAEPSMYNGIADAMSAISQQSGTMNGFVLSPQGNAAVMKSRTGDMLDFPGFTPGGWLMGLPCYTSNSAYKADESNGSTLGFAGDWQKAVVGLVNDVSIEIGEHSITDGDEQINLWQRNMFAVRAEMEVGFVVADTKYFRRLVGATGGAASNEVGTAEAA